MPSYPNLYLLMGAYFHQDWLMEASSAPEVISNFVRKEPNEVLRGLVDELDYLLAGDQDELKLRRVIDAAGGAFDPIAEGVSLAQWLVSVRDKVKSAVG